MYGLFANLANLPSILRLRGAKFWQMFVVVVGFIPPNTFACVGEDGSFNLPTFVIAFAAIMLAVSMLTFVAWIIKRVFFRTHVWFSASLISLVVLSLVLGAIGTFMVSEFEVLYVGFGADIPRTTKALFLYREFLWLPALLVVFLWHTSRHRANGTRYFAFALVVEANLLFLVLWTLYAPVFKMGSVCG